VIVVRSKPTYALLSISMSSEQYCTVSMTIRIIYPRDCRKPNQLHLFLCNISRQRIFGLICNDNSENTARRRRRDKMGGSINNNNSDTRSSNGCINQKDNYIASTYSIHYTLYSTSHNTRGIILQPGFGSFCFLHRRDLNANRLGGFYIGGRGSRSSARLHSLGIIKIHFIPSPPVPHTH